MLGLENWIRNYQPDDVITEYCRSPQALYRSASFSVMGTKRRDDDAGPAQGEWVKTAEGDHLIFAFLKVEPSNLGMFNLFFSISTSNDFCIRDDRMLTFAK
jgi:hypothetical protein